MEEEPVVEERGKAGETAGADAGDCDCDSESDARAIERRKSRNCVELGVEMLEVDVDADVEVGSGKLKDFVKWFAKYVRQQTNEQTHVAHGRVA
jgi:hypothetical protein